MSNKANEPEKPSSKMLIQLVQDNRIAEVKTQGKFKEFLNIEPPKQWIKEHPFAKGVQYLPIDKVELLLDTIFQEWRVEIKSISQLAQSIVCVARVHYKNPVTSEWSYHDGVGATPLKTDRGFSAADLSHIKSDAVQTGAPAAESYAIKDAAEHLGKIFGKDLNRADAAEFHDVYARAETEKPFTPTHARQASKTDETSSVFTPEETARFKLDMRYANLCVKLGLAQNIIRPLARAKDMAEEKIKEEIANLEEAEAEKAELQQEVREQDRQKMSETEMEAYFDRMAGYEQA